MQVRLTLPPDDATDRERRLDAFFKHEKAIEAGIKDDPYFWAVEAVWKLIDRDPEGTWTLLLEMFRRADEDYIIFSIAAGPLENFIVRHGWPFIDRIEAEARSDAKFRRALVGVWGENRMSEELVHRLRAFVEGEPLPP